MPKCPYCKEELELKLEIKPTPINDKFKSDLLESYESFIDIQAEVVPFGGKMLKRMAKYSLKFVDRYLDRVGAIPLVFHSCSNCDSVITSETLFDLMSSRGSSSS
ncbi:MAG: hypothetical protein JSV62_13755 [Promethearchaeota archaeon]|nr:MAG: hypothetical protein JSV62_13755 [Candidatus Lokiarchaeota archaeon]